MSRLIVISLLLLLALPAIAFDWEYQALDGKILHCIQCDDARERVFVGTEEGFHYLDENSGVWTDRDWVGWIGRGVHAFDFHDDLPERVITGRKNAWFKGYIEYSDDLGVSETYAYESQGGSVTGMCRDDFFHYACTWSDIAPGEFVRSEDGGESWQLLTGHGHFNMTDIAIGINGGLLISGDNYVTRSWNHGETWESLAGDLPVGYGIYCIASPSPDGDTPPDAFIYAGNDLGLYLAGNSNFWVQVLDIGCQRIDCSDVPLGLIMVITVDDRLLVSTNWGWTWNDETGNLADHAPLRDLVYSDIDHSLYVATLYDGVWRATNIVTDAPENPAPAHVALSAYPNPFNPRTEINFELPDAGRVTLDIYDLRGRLVEELFNEERPAGRNAVIWDATGMASGVYLARLSGEIEAAATTRLVLLK